LDDAMNVINGGSLLATIAISVAIAIALAIAFSYFMRPRTRALYPGGPGRYLAAISVQAIGFLAPIPVVLILMIGQPVPAGLDVVLAVAVGLGIVFALRAAPVTGPLLKDLHRARVEAAMERLGRKP
jgi:hypothetical protein